MISRLRTVDGKGGEKPMFALIPIVGPLFSLMALIGGVLATPGTLGGAFLASLVLAF